MFSFWDCPSGQGGSHKIFSLFELSDSLVFRWPFMIIVDELNNCLEIVNVVDRIFRKIFCINRYKLDMNRVSIAFNQALLFTTQFLDLDVALL